MSTTSKLRDSAILQAWGCLHGHPSVLAGAVLNAVVLGIGHAHEQLREGQAVVAMLQASVSTRLGYHRYVGCSTVLKLRSQLLRLM